MEKRFLVALVLSFLVISLYSSFLKKPNLVENKEVTNKVEVVASEAQPVAVQSDFQVQVLKNEYNSLETNKIYSISSNGLELRFSKDGGYLFEVYDTKNNLLLPFQNIGFVKEWSKCLFEPTQIQDGVSFEYHGADGSVIKKTYQLVSHNALLLTVDLSGVTASVATGYNILAGYFDPTATKDSVNQRYYETSVLSKEMVFRKAALGTKKSIEYEKPIGWLGLRDTYFCTIFLPQIPANKAIVNNVAKGVEVYVSIPERSITNNVSIEDQYKIYLGVQDEKAIKAFSPGCEKIINYGTFDSISKIFLVLLNATHKVVKNWGLAIIAVTILIYIVLFPLSYKSLMSMRRMQTMQPKVEELRTKYKDDPKKLNMEIMDLYRKEKVNPLGGCLPMLLQIPVFFAFYQLMVRFIELRGAKFLWIQDLSAPDRLLVFKNLPMIGNELNILPLLMAVGMFFQQKMSSAGTNATSATAEQQKIMLIVMPIMFGVLFYKMSSGLVLYWFVNNLLMLAFQWKISKIKQ